MSSSLTYTNRFSPKQDHHIGVSHHRHSLYKTSYPLAIVYLNIRHGMMQDNPRNKSVSHLYCNKKSNINFMLKNLLTYDLFVLSINENSCCLYWCMLPYDKLLIAHILSIQLRYYCFDWHMIPLDKLLITHILSIQLHYY